MTLLSAKTGIIALTACLLGAYTWSKATAWIERRRVRRRRIRGVRAESKAKKILKNHGFDLLDTQIESQGWISVNGEPRRFQMRPDGLARKAGRDYIVEIKSGAVATQALYRETRRQLLEYAYHLNAETLLLVNADTGAVDEISFHRCHRERSWTFLSLALGFILGVSACYWALRL